jgi:hypothetical protein
MSSDCRKGYDVWIALWEDEFADEESRAAELRSVLARYGD